MSRASDPRLAALSRIARLASDRPLRELLEARRVTAEIRARLAEIDRATAAGRCADRVASIDAVIQQSHELWLLEKRRTLMTELARAELALAGAVARAKKAEGRCQALDALAPRT